MNDTERQQLRFTASQILQLLTLLAILTAGWVDLRARVDALDAKVSYRLSEQDRRISLLERREAQHGGR